MRAREFRIFSPPSNALPKTFVRFDYNRNSLLRADY